MSSLQHDCVSFDLVDGVRDLFEFVDEMEVRDSWWYEEVDGVDGVFRQELDTDIAVVLDPGFRGITGDVGGGGW